MALKWAEWAEAAELAEPAERAEPAELAKPAETHFEHQLLFLSRFGDNYSLCWMGQRILFRPEQEILYKLHRLLGY